jgi:hypothetical protein
MSAFRAERFAANPIIYPGMPGLEGARGENINGPSLLRVPEWVERPLGKYYLYFAHHQGAYIRMAYADELAGPRLNRASPRVNREPQYGVSRVVLRAPARNVHIAPDGVEGSGGADALQGEQGIEAHVAFFVVGG